LILPPPLDIWNIQPPMSDESYRWQRGVFDQAGKWWPLLTPKGYEVFTDTHRSILLKGCRKSSKTVSAANRFTKHLWENDGAVAGVFARTMKNGMGGSWNDLVNFVFPGWQAADFGFEVTERGTNASTKMPFVRIKNMHGGTSEVQLHSVNFEGDIESQVMSLRFSAIWFSQAEQFMSVDTYRILMMQLRMELFGIPRSSHICILDANPPEDGPDHWLWHVFEGAKDPESKHYRADYHEHFSSYEFGLDDNPLLPEPDKHELKELYKSDQLKYDRMVLGKWVKDTTTGFFDTVFLPNIHIKGKADSINRADWEIITPHKDCRILVTGSDPGAVSNHATSFLCPRTDSNGEMAVDIFDEVVSIGKQVPVKKFAYDVFERVKFWSEWVKREHNLKQPIQWYHFADDSVAGYDARANRTDAQIFYDISNGQMNLIPVKKGHGSILERVDMIKRLFFDNRLFISAHCRWNIEWARFLKPGRTKEKKVADSSKHLKHSFDASSYGIRAIMPHDFSHDDQPSVATGIITT
jgi:hypothetical protein